LNSLTLSDARFTTEHRLLHHFLCAVFEMLSKSKLKFVLLLVNFAAEATLKACVEHYRIQLVSFMEEQFQNEESGLGSELCSTVRKQQFFCGFSLISRQHVLTRLLWQIQLEHRP
jgi:hypothetical protein